MTKILLACGCFLLLLCSLAAAQAPDELAPGTRIDLRVGGRSIVAGIRALDADTLRLTLWDHPGFYSVPWEKIERLRVSRGRESRWRSAARWGWRSAVVFCLISLPLTDTPEDVSLGEAIAGNLAGGFTMGAIYGAFAPRERWEQVLHRR
jgi:hypothetical protein